MDTVVGNKPHRASNLEAGNTKYPVLLTLFKEQSNHRQLRAKAALPWPCACKVADIPMPAARCSRSVRNVNDAIDYLKPFLNPVPGLSPLPSSALNSIWGAGAAFERKDVAEGMIHNPYWGAWTPSRISVSPLPRGARYHYLHPLMADTWGKTGPHRSTPPIDSTPSFSKWHRALCHGGALIEWGNTRVIAE